MKIEHVNVIFTPARVLMGSKAIDDEGNQYGFAAGRDLDNESVANVLEALHEILDEIEDQYLKELAKND